MSTKPPTRRSPRLHEQKLNEMPQKPNLSLNKIPTEIRLKILESVLVIPDHLSFSRTPLSASAYRLAMEQCHYALESSPTLRLCRWRHCKNNETLALALHADFGALCLVSKQMRAEARDVFFARNSWVLHVAYCLAGIDAIDWILKYWGREGLAKMSNVRIELQSTYPCADWQAFKALEKFVDVVKEDGSLKTLAVQWIASSRHLSCARHPHHTPHVPSLLRDCGIERNSTGGRGRNSPAGTVFEHRSSWAGEVSEPKWWAVREVVLMPLQELRGVKGSIEGTVTEKWALWLENCMVSRSVEEKGGFTQAAEAMEAAQKMKEAAMGETYAEMMKSD